MRTSILVIKINRQIFALSVVMVAFFCSFYYLFQTYWHGLDLALEGGYRLARGEPENWRIVRYSRTVVAPVVIDVAESEDYIVGLQMPAEHLVCDGGAGYKIRILNTIKYFIISIDSGKVETYDSEKIFKDKLNTMGIFNKVKLDYSKFYSMSGYYNNFYKNVDVSKGHKIIHE